MLICLATLVVGDELSDCSSEFCARVARLLCTSHMRAAKQPERKRTAEGSVLAVQEEVGKGDDGLRPHTPAGCCILR